MNEIIAIKNKNGVVLIALVNALEELEEINESEQILQLVVERKMEQENCFYPKMEHFRNL